MAWLAPLIFVSGCSTLVQISAPQAYPVEVRKVLSGRDIFDHSVNFEELPGVDIFAITPEMATFAENAIKNSGSTFGKVKALHESLLLPEKEGGRGLSYSAYSTQVPIITFRERRANCLSFSLLYVALARHIKLNAQLNEVQIPPAWDMRNKNSLMLFRHVNVKLPLRPRRSLVDPGEDAIIDLEMKRYKPNYPQSYISDSLAAAQYYSNHGMELADQGKVKDAFLYLRKALYENDQQSYIWNNLGSIYSQQNLLHEAEIIYLYGLKIDSTDLSIMTNLAELYSKMGNSERQAAYTKLVQHHRYTNPYYQYIQALSAFDNGDNVNALLYVKRAIAREKHEPRFYQLAANIYEQMGDLAVAANMNKTYQKMLMSDR